MPKCWKFWYSGDMKRSLVRMGRLSGKRNDDFVPGSPRFRLSLVWPLTEEIASLSKCHDVKQRLQRDVAVLSRRGR